MKKIFLLTVILIGSLTFTTAFKNHQGGDAYAKIEFNKTVHDYGKIAKGADGSCTFIFTNKGNDVLFITRVVSGCGCTTPVYSREPIMPGKSSEIKVGYDTNLLGSFDKKITVYTNAVNNAVTLTIKGEVVESNS